MNNKNDLAIQIGKRLKELRKSMGVSMKQLAEKTKLSIPLFSRIENGLLMPSIPTLQGIANALKVDIGYLFRMDKEKDYVIRRQGARKIYGFGKGIRKGKPPYKTEVLAEGMKNPFMEPAIVTMLIGKEEEVEFSNHSGQEFCYVLEGRVELILGDEKYVLNKGDSAYWNGNIPHKGVSLSKKPARTLNVHMIPGSRIGTFRTYD
jgi:transcriptional regulator with XRE-family HTH domain